MNDRSDPRQDRDARLADAYYTYGWGLRTQFSTWIEEEAQETETMLELLETLASGNPEGQAILRGKRERVADIRERREAQVWMENKCKDIKEQVYDDPLDARIYIDEAIWRYENAIRALLYMRRFIESYKTDVDEVRDDEEDEER